MLAVRRGIEPQRGGLAFPGGFINLGETWQQAGAREAGEETGLVIDPDEIQPFDVYSAPDGTLLIFGLARSRSIDDLPPFVPNIEATERLVIRRPEDLCWERHTLAAIRFFDQRGTNQDARA